MGVRLAQVCVGLTRMFSLLKKIFGSSNDRLLKQLRRHVVQINGLEPQVQALSDDDLRAKTDVFKARLADGETLDQLLPEAFAVVREAGVRVFGMRHFDVQLLGGMVLHHGQIAEMRTGEFQSALSGGSGSSDATSTAAPPR